MNINQCFILKPLRNLLDDDFFSKLAEEAEKDDEVRDDLIRFVIWILIGCSAAADHRIILMHLF